MDNVRSSLNQLIEWCKKERDFLKIQLDKLEAGQLTVLEARGEEAKADITVEIVQLVIHQITELNGLWQTKTRPRPRPTPKHQKWPFTGFAFVFSPRCPRTDGLREQF